MTGKKKYGLLNLYLFVYFFLRPHRFAAKRDTDSPTSWWHCTHSLHFVLFTFSLFLPLATNRQQTRLEWEINGVCCPQFPIFSVDVCALTIIIKSLQYFPVLRKNFEHTLRTSANTLVPLYISVTRSAVVATTAAVIAVHTFTRGLRLQPTS